MAMSHLKSAHFFKFNLQYTGCLKCPKFEELEIKTCNIRIGFRWSELYFKIKIYFFLIYGGEWALWGANQKFFGNLYPVTSYWKNLFFFFRVETYSKEKFDMTPPPPLTEMEMQNSVFNYVIGTILFRHLSWNNLTIMFIFLVF